MRAEEDIPPQLTREAAPKAEGSCKGSKGKDREKEASNAKRRCISTACIACRKRKSKCDGNLPSCAACSSVYGTECVYDPNSDHRRKGVYKQDIDNLKTRNTTLQTLIQGLLNSPEDEVFDLVKDIRSSKNLDNVAEALVARDASEAITTDELEDDLESESDSKTPRFVKELSGRTGELHFEGDAIRFLGGTSNLLYDDSKLLGPQSSAGVTYAQQYVRQEDAIRSWTTVTSDVELIIHLLNMYFTWHYTFFATLSKYIFFRDFFRGKPIHNRRSNEHCTPLLVNAMLALGCHFTSWPAARSNPVDGSTAGDHFFKEAKRLFLENDEYEKPRLTTVQALALMSVREAGCARETKGWVYSGMSFRMACDLGLNVHSEASNLDEHEVDARRITFWGCFLFDKCWSNYLGRQPQLPLSNITVPKFEVFPSEDADVWFPWTDSGLDDSSSQPSRTRAVAILISTLCEISNDILLTFYRLGNEDKKLSRLAEINRLSEFHTRLEAWRKQVPPDMEPREGQLPHVLVMHMFFHLLFTHLFRPFLKYAQTNGALPPNVKPRHICTQSAVSITKLLRTYKRTHGLRHVCSIVVYMAHSACTIHLLNLPDKNARRDVVHSARALEEIAEGWLCAWRTLSMLGKQAKKWDSDLPSDAAAIFNRAEERYVRDFSPPFVYDSRSLSENSPISGSGAMLPPGDQSRIPKPTMTHNTAILRARTTQTSLGDSFSMSSKYGPQNRGNVGPSPAGVASPSSVGKMSPSPSSMLAGSLPNYEDSKDWWAKDQSILFDQWAGNVDVSRMSSVATMDNVQQANPRWDATMMGIDGGQSDQRERKGFGIGSHGYSEGDMHGLDYLDFPGNIYGYQRNEGT